MNAIKDIASEKNQLLHPSTAFHPNFQMAKLEAHRLAVARHLIANNLGPMGPKFPTQELVGKRRLAVFKK